MEVARGGVEAAEDVFPGIVVEGRGAQGIDVLQACAEIEGVVADALH